MRTLKVCVVAYAAIKSEGIRSPMDAQAQGREGWDSKQFLINRTISHIIVFPAIHNSRGKHYLVIRTCKHL